MKKIIRFLALFVAMTLVSAVFPACEKEKPSLSSTEANQTFETEDPRSSVTMEIPATEPVDVPNTTDVPEPTNAPEEEHTHAFALSVHIKPTCAKQGEDVYVCPCGQSYSKPLAKTAHTWKAATCTQAQTCTVCGATGQEALKHNIVDGTCTRCHEIFHGALYAMEHSFDFDEPMPSVLSKAGTPTETLTEGNKISLVYAADYQRFTVFQIDEQGLWGIFTFDPAAFCHAEGQYITLSDFTAPLDPYDFREKQFADSYTITAFCDSFCAYQNYAIWFRISDVGYDYAYDAEITENYAAQEKLCFYFTNALRVKNGLAALSYSPQAAVVARDYAQYMAEHDFFGHDDSYKTRLHEQGISWYWIGENISEGYDHVFSVMNAYYNSDAHRQNILNSNFTHLGTGFALSGKSANIVYGAQEFYSLK